MLQAHSTIRFALNRSMMQFCFATFSRKYSIKRIRLGKHESILTLTEREQWQHRYWCVEMESERK